MTIANMANLPNIPYNIIYKNGDTYGVIAPVATSGTPLVISSAGDTAPPEYGQVSLVSGGTGTTSFPLTGVVVSGATSTDALSALPIGTAEMVFGSATAPQVVELVAGTGISLNITTTTLFLSQTLTGRPYTTITDAITMVNGNIYGTNASVGSTVFELPSSPELGWQVGIAGQETPWTLEMQTGQQCVVGTDSTIVGVGGAVDGNENATLMLVCTQTTTTEIWSALSFTGTITVT